MADDATRRLLKIFGVTVTDFEATSTQILEQARALVETGTNLAGFLPLFEELNRVTQDLRGKWMEVTTHITELQNRADAELVQYLGEARQKGREGG